MRAWMKYWLIAVSSAESTSWRTLRMSGSPCTRTSNGLTPWILSPFRAEVSFPHEREGSAGPRRRRRGAHALEEDRREDIREDAAVEVRLDDRLRSARRAAGGPRHAAGLRLRAGPRLAGGVPVHPRRPGDRLPREA